VSRFVESFARRQRDVGPDALKDLPGYGGDVEVAREKGCALMRDAG
jgi:hypothetical protein